MVNQGKPYIIGKRTLKISMRYGVHQCLSRAGIDPSRDKIYAVFVYK